MRSLLAGLSVCLLFASNLLALELEVKDVVVTPRWPWNGLVDIDYEVTSDDPNVDVWVYPQGTDNDRNIAVMLRTLTGAGANGQQVKPGKHRMTWDAAKDMPSFNSSSFTMKMQVFSGAAPYLVVDLSEGTNAVTYPVRYSAEPPDLTDDTCRTSNLWLRLIPAGTFMMGSPSDELGRSTYEYLQEDLHQVTITKPFYMGVFEVTEKQWKLIAGESLWGEFWGDTNPMKEPFYGEIRGWDKGIQWPVDNQVDGTSFMGILRRKTSLTFDLPTEAQWEYACRAGSITALNSGHNLTNPTNCPNMNEVGWYSYSDWHDASFGKVGVLIPNAWGLYDMHGNVGEWCLDWWQDRLGTDAVIDPIGPTIPLDISFNFRMVRGGSYGSSAQDCRSASRNAVYQDDDFSSFYFGVGFRVSIQLGNQEVAVTDTDIISGASMCLNISQGLDGQIANGVEVKESPDGSGSVLGVATDIAFGAPIRLDVRQGLGGQIAYGVELKGKPDGSSVAQWDTAEETPGWKILTSAEITKQVIVLDSASTTVNGGRLVDNTTWGADKVHVVRHWVVVPSGKTLTIERGGIVKFTENTGILVESGGACIANGVTFTHLADDEVGGDTNMDRAATQPVADVYTLTGVTIDGATVLRYRTEIISGTLSGAQTWYAGRVILVSGNITIPNGATLTIQPGVIVKMTNNASITVNSGGTLNAIGTRAQPIIFTSYRDDAHGGDTNKDGDSATPQPGDWKKITVSGTATFDYASLLYGAAGTSIDDMILITGGKVAFNNSRIAHGMMYAVGFESGRFAMTNSVIMDCFCAFRHFLTDPVVNSVIYDCTRLSNNNNQNFKNCIISRINTAWDWSGGRGNTYQNCVIYNPAGVPLQSHPTTMGQSGNVWSNPLFVDPANGDFRLQSGSPCIDAGDGTVAPELDSYGQPRVNVLGAQATGTSADNGLYPDIGVAEYIPENAISTLDLVGMDVLAPGSARTGDSITLAWTVKNIGTETVHGAWRDTVIFVSEQGVFIEAGTLVSNGNIAPNESKTFNGTVVIPALNPGRWYVAVNLNSHHDIFEGINANNNYCVASSPTDITITSLNVVENSVNLAVSSASTTAFSLGGVSGMDGGVLLIRSISPVNVYGGNGRTPSRLGFEWQALEVVPGVWMLAIPNGVDLANVMVSIDNGGGRVANVQTSFIPGAVYLHDAGIRTVANMGTVSMTLYGGGFDSSTSIWLSGSGTIQPQSCMLVSDSQINVVFDVTGIPAGTYRINAQSGTAIRSFDALSVTAAYKPAQLVARLDMPPSMRTGRAFTAFMEYTNTGDVEMPIPYSSLTGGAGTVLRFASDDPWTDTLEMMVTSATYPVSKLKPRETRRIPFEFMYLNATGNAHVNYTYTLSSTDPFPWDTNSQYMRPAWANDTLWNLVLANMKQNIGLTWNSWLQRMRANLDYLALQGQHTHLLGHVWQAEVNNALGVDLALPTLATGTDLYRAGRGFGITLSRTYGSGLYSRMRISGIFGQGWSDNITVTLELLDNGNTFNINLPDGGTYTFGKLNNAWQSNQKADTTVLTETATEYILTYRNGTTQRFSKALKRITSIEDLTGNRLVYTYDGSQLASITHSDGQFIAFTYANNRLASASDDQGRTVTYGYTGGLLSSVTAFNGLVTEYKYLPENATALSRALNQVIQPDATTTDYTYSPADGRIATMARNGTDQLVEIRRGLMGGYSIIAPDGTVSIVHLGAFGELLGTEDPLGHVTRYVYKPDTFLLESVTSPTGKRSHFEYDHNFNPISGIDAAANKTTFGYSSGFAQLNRVTDARGRSLSYRYDAKGRPTATIYPDGKTESLEYTANGDVAASLSRNGDRITFAYDNEGRILSKVWPDGRTFTWEYDTKGNLVKISDTETGVISMTYDDAERMTRIEYPGGYGFAYVYDHVGRVTERSSHDGHALRYTYDTLGRLVEMHDQNNDLYVRNTYDPDTGRLVRQLYGNNASVEYVYDPRGFFASITHKAADGSIMDTFTYTHDPDGKRTSLKTTAGTETYGYDLTGQLTAVEYADGKIESFGYDAVGNRLTSINKGGVATAYTANAMNQYLQVGDTSFTHDENGNLATKTVLEQATRYEYDIENRLVKVAKPDGEIWSCKYDAFGNRVSVTDNGITKKYIFIQGVLPSITAEYTDGGILERRYIHVGEILIADETIESNSRRFYHADGLASTRILTGVAGTAIGNMKFDAFGSTRFTNGESTPFGYVGTLGVMNDVSIGFLWMRARSYDATMGRFIQLDPIGLNAGDINQYRYCINAIIDFNDPSGQFIPAVLIPYTVVVIGGLVYYYGIKPVVDDIRYDLSNRQTQREFRKTMEECEKAEKKRGHSSEEARGMCYKFHTGRPY